MAIARMLPNVGIEAAAGTVPLIGDLFDIAFKANRRNYQLLKSHLLQPKRQTSQDWLFLVITLIVVVVAIAIPIVALIALAKLLKAA